MSGSECGGASDERLWTPGWIVALTVMGLLAAAVAGVMLWERSMRAGHGSNGSEGPAARAGAERGDNPGSGTRTGGSGADIDTGGGEPGSGSRAARRRADDPEEAFDLSDLRIPREQIRSGGPPKDGIPALTTAAARPKEDRDAELHGPHPPRFISAEQAVREHGADARVVGLTIGGEARAYPIRVLNWHEAVNDVVGEVPVAVIYCPLCDSVSVVDRRVGGQTYEFGISGLLYNSNVLLYDRTDQALWSQVRFEAVSGPNAGEPLKHINGWRITKLGNWTERHPEGAVLSEDTGYSRTYDRNTYERYADFDRLMFPVEHEDDRLDPKERVVGVRLGDTARAYPVAAVREAGVLRDRIDGEALVIESAGVDSGVTITQAPETAQVIHTYWFAWAAMWPETELIRESERAESP